MYEAAFMETVDAICKKDTRYDAESYGFVRAALDYSTKALKKQPTEGQRKHVSGQELLEGIRRFAIGEYGPMARSVLRTWGINRTEDFGEIVFNLVEAGKLGRTEDDSRADFADGYDFHSAFEKPFLPASAQNDGTA